MSLSVFSFGQATGQLPGETTWDLFGGASFIHPTDANSSGNLYGWDASITQRPYSSYPWIGGTIRVNGGYLQTSTSISTATLRSSYSMYTAMGGPSVHFRLRPVEPFAHALVGAVIEKVNTTGIGEPFASSSTHFGYSLGGGLDVPLSTRWAIRGQADWMNTRESATQNTNRLGVSTGVVLRF